MLFETIYFCKSVYKPVLIGCGECVRQNHLKEKMRVKYLFP